MGDSGENGMSIAMIKEEDSSDHEREEIVKEEEMVEEVDELIVSDESEEDDADKAVEAEHQENASAVTADLMSKFVVDLFKESSTLHELRQNRASIMLRQNKIEQTIDE